jgi:tripartite-type tricarboxylate transporter receptor subunit TctC
VKDFIPITLIARVPNMLVVNNDVPAKNVAELIALMKKIPANILRVQRQRNVAAPVR